jgi:hypothetical protein
MMMEVFGTEAEQSLLRSWSYRVSKMKGIYIGKKDRLLTCPSW